MVKNFLVVFLICYNLGFSQQILNDKNEVDRLKYGVDCIYNFKFDSARKVYKEIKKKYPNHAIPYLYEGLLIYWENYPLIPSSKKRENFEKSLYKAIEISEKELEKNENNAEALLTSLGASGMLLLFYADNGLTSKVFSLAPRTYRNMMTSFDYTDIYSDFNYMVGLYNYYREAYPEAHPIYKPVVIFFKKGNKELGLKQLKYAGENAIFLSAEAYAFLSGIYTNFEQKVDSGLIYYSRLVKKYPNNTQYVCYLVRSLLLSKRYDMAERILNSYKQRKNLSRYFKMKLNIFNGIIYEKKYNNFILAEKCYKKGIRTANEVGDIANDYRSYALFGLSRIYAKKGDDKKSNDYRKEARKISYYKHVNFDE